MGVGTKSPVIRFLADKIHIITRPTSHSRSCHPFHRKNGPNLVAVDGKIVKQYCRCGGSSNKPFCAGTHHKNGFKAHNVETKVLQGGTFLARRSIHRKRNVLIV